MKVLVCGGRDYNDRAAVFAALDKAHAKREFSLVVYGTSPAGEDAASWARRNTILEGVVFNGDPMATCPDGVIAFPGSPAALLERALAAGVKVWCPYGEGA